MTSIDISDANGQPILPGEMIAVAVLEGRYTKRAVLRIGTVRKLTATRTGISIQIVVLNDGPYHSKRSYRNPKRMVHVN